MLLEDVHSTPLLRLHCTAPAVDAVVRWTLVGSSVAVLSSRSIGCRRARSDKPMANLPHMHLMSLLTGGAMTVGSLEMGPKVSFPDER